MLKLRGQSQIKVIDFGSSCYDHQRIYTYIQSRFYRSPEVILGEPGIWCLEGAWFMAVYVLAGLPYSMAIDMWSFGAILAELYTGYPLFPGENEAEQLACIMEIFGTPGPGILAEAQRKKLFFGKRCMTGVSTAQFEPHMGKGVLNLINLRECPGLGLDKASTDL